MMWEGAGNVIVDVNVGGVPTHFGALRWVAWFLGTPVRCLFPPFLVALMLARQRAECVVRVLYGALLPQGRHSPGLATWRMGSRPAHCLFLFFLAAQRDFDSSLILTPNRRKG
jgi:hypothetical protein